MTALSHRDEFGVFCESVRELTQIDLGQYKRGQMERRIRTWAERRGIPELPRYLDRLRTDRDELEAFLDRVTINVSQLWRNPEQWELLRGTLLPDLAARGQVRAWSAGCSYGAEAYTLAAVCREAIPSARVSIRGTDIDRRMVQRAKEGRFSVADARSAPPELLRRHFVPDEHGWRAAPALMAMVSFDVGDLLRMSPSRGAFDLVLCRNTVIYFTDDVRDALHERLADSLRPGGYLIIGATERVADAADKGLRPIHPFTYRRD